MIYGSARSTRTFLRNKQLVTWRVDIPRTAWLNLYGDGQWLRKNFLTIKNPMGNLSINRQNKYPGEKMANSASIMVKEVKLSDGSKTINFYVPDCYGEMFEIDSIAGTMEKASQLGYKLSAVLEEITGERLNVVSMPLSDQQ
ncbi:MAG: hypothetical protein PHI97_00625 [Desulfobulbus sp.]|nr:hypothetical protein [Desulfobulbus sp.]